MSYLEKKENLRTKAIEWQLSFDKCNHSWKEMAEKENYFEKQGKKYGLLKEFRENGII